MSDEQQPQPEVSPHGYREQYFKKSSHDLSGLPQGLRHDMQRLVNRGPTPEMVALVKHKWASKRTQAW